MEATGLAYCPLSGIALPVPRSSCPYPAQLGFSVGHRLTIWARVGWVLKNERQRGNGEKGRERDRGRRGKRRGSNSPKVQGNVTLAEVPEHVCADRGIG